MLGWPVSFYLSPCRSLQPKTQQAGTYIGRIHPVQRLRHVIIHVGQPETGEADGYCLRNERLQVSFPLCIVATSSSRYTSDIPSVDVGESGSRGSASRAARQFSSKMLCGSDREQAYLILATAKLSSDSCIADSNRQGLLCQLPPRHLKPNFLYTHLLGRVARVCNHTRPPRQQCTVRQLRKRLQVSCRRPVGSEKIALIERTGSDTSPCLDTWECFMSMWARGTRT
jgi:hypothetical protein